MGRSTAKPYPTYIPMLHGYEESFADWGAKTKGKYPYQMYNPHYLRRGHTGFDNVPQLREVWPNPAFISAQDAAEKGIKTGDTILITNDFGKALRHASVTERIMPGCVALPHGSWTDLDEETQIDKAGADNVMLPQETSGDGVSGYNTVLVDFVKWGGEELSAGLRKSVPTCREHRIDRLERRTKMALGFYFDGNRCSGCKTCIIACKDFKELPVGINFRRVFSMETGTYPTAQAYHYSMACNHCETPACVVNCPSGAMHKGDDGTVQHDDEICIGCQTCVQSCPYEVPQFRKDLGIVQKCDSCIQRREAGQEPSCVAACPMRAIEFGDVDEIVAKHGADLVKELPFLPAADQTNPNTNINAKPVSLATDYREAVI